MRSLVPSLVKCSNQSEILQFTKKESLAEIISRLTAEDEFGFHAIVSS